MGDDYDNGYDRRPAKNSTSTLWIVLGVLGALFLTGVLVCGGLLFFGFRAAKDMVGDFTAGHEAAESFLSQLQAGNTAGAYLSSSRDYQANLTRAQFDAFVAANPALTSHTVRDFNSFNMTTNNGVNELRVQCTLTGPNGATACTLILVEENGAWVVDSITVP